MSSPDDFDELLKIIGTGKWNYIYYFGMSVAFFIMPCFVFTSSFMAPAVDYSCIPDVPANQSDIYFRENNCGYVYTSYNSTNITVECSEWQYEERSSRGGQSLTSEFDLICDRAYLRPTYQSVQMTGQWIGALTNGYLADRYGRKRLMEIITFLIVISSTLSTFLNNFTAVLVFRAIIGLVCSGIFQIGYILCMEVCEPKHRSTVGMLIALPWAFGMMWWGALGYLIPDWRWLQRATNVPFLLVFLALAFMDESPRWLIIQGKQKQAVKAIERAAKLNNKKLPQDLQLTDVFDKIKQTTLKEKPSNKSESKLKKLLKGLFKLFRTPELRRITLLVTVIFIVSSVVYIGLSLNAVNFDLNPYVYMVVGGIMEIPAYTIVIPIIAKLGRIKPTAFFFFFCGFAIMALAFISPDIKWLVILLAMGGKMGNAAAFQIVFLFASEIFPTEVRIQALGTMSFISSVSGAVPYLTDIVGAAYPWIPSIIYGTLSIGAGIATIFIPETLNKHLFETVTQLEKEALEKKRKKKESFVAEYGDVEKKLVHSNFKQ